MLKKKKLLIAAIVLGAMLLVFIFGLSMISDVFVILGIYCGISAVLCGFFLIDLKMGEKTKLIIVGALMILFGSDFIAYAEYFSWLCFPLSVLYLITGVFVLAIGIKGIRNSRGRKKPASPKENKADAITAPDIEQHRTTSAQPAKEDKNDKDDIVKTANRSAMWHSAAELLRDQIIDRITKEPAVQYRLCQLLWQEAADCFPDSYWKWDMAQIYLDLKTGRLWAEASMYVTHHSPIDRIYSLSASEFAEIAEKYHMSMQLQVFQTDEDWERLFDDRLKAAVDLACEKIGNSDGEGP